MKKKIVKKLVLNKKTVSNLAEKEMEKIHGGSIIACNVSQTIIVICCDSQRDALAKATC